MPFTTLLLWLVGQLLVSEAYEISAFSVSVPRHSSGGGACSALDKLAGASFYVVGSRASAREGSSEASSGAAAEADEAAEADGAEREDEAAPFFKAEHTDLYIYFAHACGAAGLVEYGWVIDEAPPVNATAAARRGETVSLPENDVCRHLGQIHWSEPTAPPLGTKNWRISCNGSFRDAPLTLRPAERGGDTLAACVPSAGPGLRLGGGAAGADDARLVDMKAAWLQVGPLQRLVLGRAYPRNVPEHPSSESSVRWVVAAFNDEGLELVELDVHVVAREVYVKAVAAKRLPNRTSWGAEDPEEEANQLFEDRAAVDLQIGCPGSIEVASLTFVMLYRRAPALAEKPGRSLVIWVSSLLGLLLAVIVCIKLGRCREEMRGEKGVMEAKQHPPAAPEATPP